MMVALLRDKHVVLLAGFTQVFSEENERERTERQKEKERQEQSLNKKKQEKNRCKREREITNESLFHFAEAKNAERELGYLHFLLNCGFPNACRLKKSFIKLFRQLKAH